MQTSPKTLVARPMKARRASGLFGNSSDHLQRKHKRAFWSAILVGLVLSAILGTLLYLFNTSGHR